MELQENRGTGPTISTYNEHGFMIDDVLYVHNILVQPEKKVQNWTVKSVTSLSTETVEQLLNLKPDLILLGTGEKQIFPDERFIAQIYNAKVGIEIMDTAAACRTYNLLMAEGRNVLAALFL